MSAVLHRDKLENTKGSGIVFYNLFHEAACYTKDNGTEAPVFLNFVLNSINLLIHYIQMSTNIKGLCYCSSLVSFPDVVKTMAATMVRDLPLTTPATQSASRRKIHLKIIRQQLCVTSGENPKGRHSKSVATVMYFEAMPLHQCPAPLRKLPLLSHEKHFHLAGSCHFAAKEGRKRKGGEEEERRGERGKRGGEGRERRGAAATWWVLQEYMTSPNDITHSIPCPCPPNKFMSPKKFMSMRLHHTVLGITGNTVV